MGCSQCRGVKPDSPKVKPESRRFRQGANVSQSDVELIPVLHSDLEICNDPEPRRRTFSAQIVWPKMTEEGAYPFPEDAEDGLLLSLKLAGDGFCQEIRLAPVERFPADMVEHTITVESNEDVLAFCCDEARDEGGGALYYHPHIIIRAQDAHKTTLRMEPLSGGAVWPAPRRRGRRISLPDIEVKNLDVFKPATVDPNEDEVVMVPIDGFRCLKGQRRDHITGVQWSQSSYPRHCGNMSQHVKISSGQTVMFWFELICLDLVAWYLDLLLDVKQLVLFAKTGMMDYFFVNLAGMSLPIMLNLYEVVHFVRTESPERDAIAATGCSETWAIRGGVCAVLFQIHTFGLCIWSATHRLKHPLLACSKQSEVTEAATSAFVQANYLVCALSGVQAFADLNLSPTDLGFLAASISLSCGMLGLGFASRDKSPSRVLGLPGKKTNWDLEFLMLILVRSMEVLSRVFGTSLVHISTRFANFKLGGPVMILAMAFSSRLLFRNATAVDAMAAVVAHPGQLLEPTSLLPFHVSLLLDGMLALTLIICQILVRYDALFAEHSKAVPKEVLGAWLALTAVSCVGRSFFVYCLGAKVQCPIFKRLAFESGPDEMKAIEIMYSALPAAFNCPNEVPESILAAMPKQHLLSGLVREEDADWLEGPVRKFLRKLRVLHFSITGEKGTSSLLLSLAKCAALEDLNLDGCDKIPADAWKQLGEARWVNLKKASFRRCFGESTKGADGAAVLLLSLAKCVALEELDLEFCAKIPADAWKQLGEARWVNLKKASFPWCFDSDTVGADGAAVLLLSLAKCAALEDLDLGFCAKIPADAWKQLGEARWVNLKKASFHRCFGASTKGADGAAVLLLSLAKCAALEDLDLGACYKIPADAWKQLPRPVWPALQKSEGVPDFVELGGVHPSGGA